jgi:hypothetical protein
MSRRRMSGAISPFPIHLRGVDKDIFTFISVVGQWSNNKYTCIWRKILKKTKKEKYTIKINMFCTVVTFIKGRSVSNWFGLPFTVLDTSLLILQLLFISNRSCTSANVTTEFTTGEGKTLNMRFYSKTNQMHNIANLFYFGTTLNMFRTISPSIIRSLRLYIQHHTIQILWLLASKIK